MEKQTIGWMFMLSGKNGIVRVKVNFDDRFKDDKFYCDNEKITIVSVSYTHLTLPTNSRV